MSACCLQTRDELVLNVFDELGEASARPAGAGTQRWGKPRFSLPPAILRMGQTGSGAPGEQEEEPQVVYR